MKKLFILSTFALVLSACNAGENRTNIELVQDMMDQISLKAQDWDPKRDGRAAQLLPPENTVARGKAPYAYATDPEGAGRNLKNPMAGDRSPEVIELGKAKYDIYCAVCHGNTGDGDGTVAPKMALKPPTLLSDKVKNHTDGRIYHIITAGQGVMGSYAGQIYREEDRWAVVNYIRSLQKAGE